MNICLIYDCLFPWTIGGAERWYRTLAEKLVAEGHEVTYLTLRQWDDSDRPNLPGIRIVAVGPRMALYKRERRRIWPPIRFGIGVFGHLLVHGRDYDIIHTASFPFFSLLAAGALRRWKGYGLFCDWFEVWSKKYWMGYLGPAGIVGWWIQSLCALVPQRSYVFSQLHAERLRLLCLRGQITILAGISEVPSRGPQFELPDSPPAVVYAGRLIPEKRVLLLVEAIAIAREMLPDLRCIIFGRGPELEAVRARAKALGLQDVVEMPGFVPESQVDSAMRTALCVVQPSEREGYGLVVLEAAARGVPAIVVAGEDNAACELISDGENGFVVPRADPQPLAEAIIRCSNEAESLRGRTRSWFQSNRERLSLEKSCDLIIEDYMSTIDKLKTERA